ncbi:hypothetical protein AVEN_182280-1 [Araneus ventricosus]|uniref:Uncharacterized protein n=1 Tax=Araneus ventricosus TaxID=182803 RepID=A0A4Y2DSK1_ARAVE|nr:hypothetical protein AVEN_190146-1 [Araneus ventricosus]GBM19119.1 hypothetical protein AVEN_182280-1 [Araneus ventricosus]
MLCFLAIQFAIQAVQYALSTAVADVAPVNHFLVQLGNICSIWSHRRQLATSEHHKDSSFAPAQLHLRFKVVPEEFREGNSSGENWEVYLVNKTSWKHLLHIWSHRRQLATSEHHKDSSFAAAQLHLRFKDKNSEK